MLDAFPLLPLPIFPSPPRYAMKGGTNSVQVKQRVFFITYPIHLLNYKLNANSQTQVWLGTKASSQNLPQYVEERLPAGSFQKSLHLALVLLWWGSLPSPAAHPGRSGTT